MDELTNLQPQSILKQLGLSEEEIVIYHALLGEPDSISIRNLALKTKLNRGIVYESIKSLLTHGLVAFNRKGERRFYFAERPSRIYELIEQKKKELDLVDARAKSLVPRLQAALKRNDGKPLVRFYEYDEGISAILHDVLKTVKALETKEYHAYSHQKIRPYLYRNFPNFSRQRIKEGIFVKVIKVGKGEPTNGLDEVKWLSASGEEEARSYEIIYGDKVAMISVSNDGTPYGVVIEEKGVAVMRRLLFLKLWDTLD